MASNTNTENTYQVIGTADEFPYLDNINTDWNHFLVTDLNVLDECSPDILSVNRIYVYAKINKLRIVDSPIYDENPNNNMEGALAPGRKMIVEGVLCYNIIYTADNAIKSIHSAVFTKPFSHYIVLKNENADEDTNYTVKAYIEDAFINLQDSRSIFTTISLFLTAIPEFVTKIEGAITVNGENNTALSGSVFGTIKLRNTESGNIYSGQVSNGSYSVTVFEPGNYVVDSLDITIGGMNNSVTTDYTDDAPLITIVKDDNTAVKTADITAEQFKKSFEGNIINLLPLNNGEYGNLSTLISSAGIEIINLDTNKVISLPPVADQAEFDSAENAVLLPNYTNSEEAKYKVTVTEFGVYEVNDAKIKLFNDQVELQTSYNDNQVRITEDTTETPDIIISYEPLLWGTLANIDDSGTAPLVANIPEGTAIKLMQDNLAVSTGTITSDGTVNYVVSNVIQGLYVPDITFEHGDDSYNIGKSDPETIPVGLNLVNKVDLKVTFQKVI